MRDELLLEYLGSHLLPPNHSLPLLVEVGCLVIQGLLPSQHVDPLACGFRQQRFVLLYEVPVLD